MSLACSSTFWALGRAYPILDSLSTRWLWVQLHISSSDRKLVKVISSILLVKPVPYKYSQGAQIGVYIGSSVDAVITCGDVKRALCEEFVSKSSQRMMSRGVSLCHSFLPLVSIATFWCVVYVQSNIDGPYNPSLVESIGRPCARSWWTTMWGFIVTLIALTMDAWEVTKSMSESAIINVGLTFIGRALNPLLVLRSMLESIVHILPMLVNHCEALRDDVIAPLSLGPKWQILNNSMLNLPKLGS